MERLDAFPESPTQSVFGSQSAEPCDNTAGKAKALCDSAAKNSDFGMNWRACMRWPICGVGMLTGSCIAKSSGGANGEKLWHQGECGPFVALSVAHLWRWSVIRRFCCKELWKSEW